MEFYEAPKTTFKLTIVETLTHFKVLCHYTRPKFFLFGELVERTCPLEEVSYYGSDKLTYCVRASTLKEAIDVVNKWNHQRTFTDKVVKEIQIGELNA